MYYNLKTPDLYENTSVVGITTVRAGGEIVPIRINGRNKPTFSMTIKDSSGCSILKKQLKNIDISDSGEFLLNQEFPALNGNDSEIYDLIITPSADTHYWFGSGANAEHIKSGVMRKKIFQFKKPTLTFTNSTCSDCGTHSITATDVTYTGEPRDTRKTPTALTHTTTITRTSGATNLYLSKKPHFDNCITRSDIIKKVVNRNIDEQTLSSSSEFLLMDSSTSTGAESAGFTPTYSGDINPGMEFSFNVVKTKTIMRSIPLDVMPDDDCVECTKTQILKTNKLEVENTYDLIVGMIVSTNSFSSELISIDCEKRITISSEEIILAGETITFTHKGTGKVISSTRQNDGIKISTTPLLLPHKTQLEFYDKKRADIQGRIKIDRQGSDKMVITTTINDLLLGKENVTFTLDLDSFITTKPPNKDRYFTIGKNTSTVPFTLIDQGNINDKDKTITISRDTKQGSSANISHRSEGGTLNTLKSYTPATNFSGLDTMKYTISDGTTTSDEKTIFITVK